MFLKMLKRLIQEENKLIEGTYRDIFTLSPVNGAFYIGEHLSRNNWDWPKNTFLQRRLQELRDRG
jgi:hypothetical protein